MICKCLCFNSWKSLGSKKIKLKRTNYVPVKQLELTFKPKLKTHSLFLNIQQPGRVFKILDTLICFVNNAFKIQEMTTST